MTTHESGMTLDVDDLANEIRRVDGGHLLGAPALAQALMPFLASHLAKAKVPDGWKLVPVEPTYIMKNDGVDANPALTMQSINAVWQAMLNAVPTHDAVKE